MKRRPLIGSARVAAVAAVVLAGITICAGAASAHVSVNPNALTQGGYGRVAFRVPNESTATATVKVEVFLPEEHPIRSVSTMPVPGWTVTVDTRNLDQPLAGGEGADITEVVSKLTWTADGAANAIQHGQFQEFPVSMGPLPQTDRLIFKTLQTYSDGSVVRWIEEPAEGQQIDHPAPVLRLAPPAAATPGVAADAGGDAHGDGGDNAALVLSIIAIIAGVTGVTLGGLALTRVRRP